MIKGRMQIILESELNIPIPNTTPYHLQKNKTLKIADHLTEIIQNNGAPSQTIENIEKQLSPNGELNIFTFFTTPNSIGKLLMTIFNKSFKRFFEHAEEIETQRNNLIQLLEQ